LTRLAVAVGAVRSTLTVNGSLLPGGATWINAVQGSGNSWSYDNTGNTLADGSYSIQTRVVDAAGNTGT
ncbi:Ig-like domain-containing protein, partial [Acinetobacter soli]